MPIPKDVTIKTLLNLISKYNDYIQSANDDDRYATGWYPCCIDEFYDNEFQEEDQ